MTSSVTTTGAGYVVCLTYQWRLVRSDSSVTSRKLRMSLEFTEHGIIMKFRAILSRCYVKVKFVYNLP